MRIKLLSLFLFISFAGNAQTVTHREELDYYVAIVREITELEPKVQNVWGMIQNAVITAGKDPSRKLDAGKISDLRSASSSNVSDVNRSMRLISSLYEVDSALNIKQRAVDLLTDIKSIQEASMPGIATVLAKGVDKMTPQETSSMKNFLSVGENLRYKLRDLKGLFNIYKIKHSLTDEELKKYRF